MKNIKLVFLLIILSSTIFSQESVHGTIGISQSFHNDNFMETNLKVGVLIPKINESFSILAHYSYNGNLKVNKNGEDIPLYTMTSHFLGLAVNHRMFNDNSFYSPSLTLSIQTEISTNYRDKKVGRDYQPMQSYGVERFGEGLSFAHSTYSLKYYVSTPVLGRITLGNEFRINDMLKMSLDLGLYFRTINTGFKSWIIFDDEGFLGDPLDRQPEPDFSNAYKLKNAKPVYNFDFSISLIYKFPLLKKNIK